MQLPETILQAHIEDMPSGPDHITVWHLCHEDRHSKCSGKIGELAIVHGTPPEVPDIDQEGYFLMRLHPLAKMAKPIDTDTSEVWLPAATSSPHATVWHVPKQARYA
jgi:hypothetical protein